MTVDQLKALEEDEDFVGKVSNDILDIVKK